MRTGSVDKSGLRVQCGRRSGGYVADGRQQMMEAEWLVSKKKHPEVAVEVTGEGRVSCRTYVSRNLDQGSQTADECCKC